MGCKRLRASIFCERDVIDRHHALSQAQPGIGCLYSWAAFSYFVYAVLCKKVPKCVAPSFDRPVFETRFKRPSFLRIAAMRMAAIRARDHPGLRDI